MPNCSSIIAPTSAIDYSSDLFDEENEEFEEAVENVRGVIVNA